MAPACGTLVPVSLWGDFHESVDQGFGRARGVACLPQHRHSPTASRTAPSSTRPSWKPASEAEAKAKELGYEVRRSKVEGSCYEVYGVKEGKLFELFYSPEDLSLKQTIAKN